MLIRKINSVFMRHSRWLFGIFTIVIIVSFLGFLTPGQFGVGGCSEPGAMRVGTIFGEAVSYNDLRDMQQSLALYYRLANNMEINVDAQQAFFALARLRAAERRGISVSDSEIAEMLQQFPVFQLDGKFSYKQYQTVVENLRHQGIDGEMVARCFRDMVVMGKLEQELMASVITTPGEVETFFREANEKYEVKVAEFRREAFAKQVKIDPAKLMEYFKANRASYVVSAQLTALVVEFPLTAPAVIAEAEKVNEVAVKAYFDANKDAFAKDGKVPAYEAVKKEARRRCIADRVKAAVNRQAQGFAHAAYDAVGEASDKPDAFQKLAAKSGLKVVRTAKFAADAESAGAIAEPELVKQLATVFESVPVSNAVPGKNAYFVGMVIEREAERPAEFNEVNRQVQEDFIRIEATKLAREAAVKGAKTLAALPVKTRMSAKEWDRTLTFSMVNPPMVSEGAAVMMAAMPLAINGVSGSITTPDGALVVGMAKRIPADMAEFAKNRAQWEMIWMRQKSGLQFADFQRYLAGQVVFEMGAQK